MSVKIEIGQTWIRSNGKRVQITAKRISKGLTEYELTPLDKGRKSWKWDQSIASTLKPAET